MSYVPRLRDKYSAEVVPAMMEKFNYKNVMQIPCITKVVLNQGVGAAVNDKKLVDAAIDEMSKITGQKAQATYSKKAISNFKLAISLLTSEFTYKGNSYCCWSFTCNTSVLFKAPIIT